jgi:hypothetical protein
MSLFDDADFAHLTPSGTARYTLSAVNIPRGNPEPVVLIVKHAGEGNERYQSAIMKAARATGREAMKQRATIFAKHVITGWENVLKDGKPVPYTWQDGEELLHKLIDAKRWEVEVAGLITFSRDPDNFQSPAVDAGDLGNG